MTTTHKDVQNFEAGLTIKGLSSNPLKSVLFDDFLGDVLADQWSGAAGNDDLAVAPAITSAISGKVRLTTGNTVTVSESASSLTHALNWKADQGGLVFEAKVTGVSSVANVAYFVGLSDTIATGTLEEPITLSTTVFTANAADAVGFVFDTAATTDVWYGVGVAATVVTAGVTGVAPVAGTAQTLRIEVDAIGTATFYINGALQGSVAAAVTPTVALTPIVVAMARTTTSKSLDVDYISLEQTR